VGRLDVQQNIVGSLLLTAIVGTTANTLGHATRTLPRCLLSEGFPVELLLAPDLREVPLRLRIYPDVTPPAGGVGAVMVFGTAA
jgi:hypothetical protein